MQKTKKQARPTLRRWTVKEFLRMADEGFFRNQRVELIEGVVIDMPAQTERHYAVIEKVRQGLEPIFGPGHWARTQAPLRFGPRSAPEPDVAIVLGKPGDYATAPMTALLIIEVSESSLYYDRGRKANLYARAGIADYWIVNLVNLQLEVRRTPVPDSSQRYGFGYADVTILKPTDKVSPLAVPQATIGVADLLP